MTSTNVSTTDLAPAATYYAVCDAGGPISVELDAHDTESALAAFAALDERAAIDAAMTDAEDALGIAGEGMSESEFAAAIEAAGGESVCDLEPVHNYHAGTTAHLAGGWTLWRVEGDRGLASELYYADGSLVEAGDRVESADDTGIVHEIDVAAGLVTVGWDSGVRTVAPVTALELV